MTIFAVIAALAAAMSFAWAAILQQETAALAPEDKTLKLSLITDLLRQPKWILGGLLLVVGYGFQLVALANGPVALVQPIVIMELVFAVPLAIMRCHRSAGWREWAGLCGVIVGVGVFLLVASPQSGVADPAGATWLLGVLPITFLTATVIMLAAKTKGPVRAMSLGAAAGLCFGVLAVLTKSIAYVARDNAGQIVTSWQLYAAIVSGIGALVLSQSAYQAGPLAYSMPVVAILEPMAAVTLGATILGERIYLDGPALFIELLAVLLAFAGIGLLATSAMVLQIYQEGRSPTTETDHVEGHRSTLFVCPAPVEDRSAFRPGSTTDLVEHGSLQR